MTKSKKTLDTLVEDIYNKIGVLADGEHIDLDPETIDPVSYTHLTLPTKA